MSNENSTPPLYPLGEPSVLDYVKALFRGRNGDRIHLPSPPGDGAQVAERAWQDEVFLAEAPVAQPEPALAPEPLPPFPWRSLLALGLALLGQNVLEPPANIARAIVFYILALAILVWAINQGEWSLSPLLPGSSRQDPLSYRGLPLALSIGFALLGFLLFGNHLFTTLNLVVWALAVLCLLWAFWLQNVSVRSAWGRVATFLRRETWTIHISRWTLVLLAATAVALFFRFHQTTTVPPEPFSDHAEKILDVYEASQGQLHVFFERNTGREAIQMYWTLLVSKIFGTGLSFISLKLGTALLGFLTLPFIYLLGKEIGGRRVGLIAFVLVGIAYWPNVISRVGLRFPLYPLFAAPVLYFLIRGLRRRSRNDFLLAGLFLGIGLHGYTPIQVVPVVVVVAFVVYWLHTQSQGARQDLPVWLVMLALVALFIFIPLLRYRIDEPDKYGSRAITRLTSVEQPLPGPALQIFVTNVGNALAMFNYHDGQVWVNSVPYRPALDIVSAALFVIGFVLVLVRYIRHRHWLDLFLLISIPLLQLPSSLSLAFPAENPAINRAGGAYIPVFLLVALALDGLITSFGRRGARVAFAWGLAALLFLFSASQNYDLVFREYYTTFRNSSWNTSDMGRVLRQFEQTYGTTETVWIVPFRHWVDTRLPPVWAGIPNRDIAMWRENLDDTLAFPGPKLFMVKADLENPEGNDQESLDVLESLYPQGQLRLFDSEVQGHDFWIFTVPGE